MELDPILVSTLAAVIYSLIWFFRSVIDPDKPTVLKDFSGWKLAGTIVVGAGIGIITTLSGDTISQIGVESQLLAYGFVIAAADQFGSALYRKITNVE